MIFIEKMVQIYFLPKRLKRVKDLKNLYLLKSDMDEKEEAKDLIYIIKTSGSKRSGIRGKRAKKLFLNYYFIDFRDSMWDAWFGSEHIQPLINAENQLKSHQTINKFNL